jgi:hypothetical protein
MAGDELIIPGSRKKALLVLLIGTGFVVGGIFLILKGEAWGWLVAGFFGPAIPVALWMLSPNNSYLKLDRNGVEMKTFWRPMQIKWTDVDDFFVTTIYGNKMVGIRYSSTYRSMNIGRKLASAISGVEGALPNHFQSSPEEICEKLNQWRQRFGALRSNPQLLWTGSERSSTSTVIAAGTSQSTTLSGMISAFPWRLLLLKLAALFSFCGGPLVLADSLKVHIDKDLAFVIAFLPSAALIFGVYSLWRATVRDLWDTAMVLIGALGAIALISMNVFAILELAKGPARADAGLIELGIAVGTVLVAFYGYASTKFFRLPGTAA